MPWKFLGDQLDGSVQSNFESVVKIAESNGATIVDVDLPHAEFGVAAYYVIANAEASANLARFDGVKYGYRTADAKDLLSMYTRTRDEGFGDEVKRRILLGTYVLSSGYYDAYYHKAQQVRSLIINDFNDAFAKCDNILLPTAPTPAFKIGEKIDDPVTMYLSDVFTIPVNLAGLPAISFPSGLSPERLPIGAQLIGKAFDESTMLRAARGFEREIDFKERPDV